MRYELNNELLHFGIKGQKWGVRRFQNDDGSLTATGKERYLEDDQSDKEKIDRRKNIAKKVAVGAGLVATALISSYLTTKVSNAKSNRESKSFISDCCSTTVSEASFFLSQYKDIAKNHHNYANFIMVHD